MMMKFVKIKLRKSRKENKEGMLYYQLIYQRRVKVICSGMKVYSWEWNMDTMRITFDHSIPERVKHLLNVESQLKKDLERINEVILILQQRKKEFSVKDIVTGFKDIGKNTQLIQFVQERIEELYSIGSYRTAETYNCTLNSFNRFLNSQNIDLHDMDAALIKNYELFLKKEDLTLNTISFYMRILRAIYNKAVYKGLIEQKYPFKNVYTGIDKTQKRAINIEILKMLKQLDLSFSAELDFTRDIFLFSFYTRGMSFIDIAYLKKKNIENGNLSYKRRKTCQKLVVKWEPYMQEIVDKYKKRTVFSPYIFPIILPDCVDTEREQYRKGILTMNKNLKKISELLSLAVPLTTYVARHTWASIAKEKNIPLAVISEGMGHDSENTTRIYLASLDKGIVDNANSLIISSLLG